MFSTDDTIAAIATAPGRGGIGVVRLSGPHAHIIAMRLTGRGDRPFEARRATFARLQGVVGGSGTPVGDHVVCTFFQAPHSYTGDDVIEVSAHGSPVVLTGILDQVTRLGVRLARPGEFTLRAYLNGRLDLVQAEAVADLVEAVTPTQARAAFEQLDGSLTERLRTLRARAFDVVVRLEACLDFPEEDYHFITRPELIAALGELDVRIGELLARASAGRAIREGAVVVIAGRPNVGKSSLFNALLGTGRAIVTAVPGTTRDLLSERADIHGIPVTLVDTAGDRDTDDDIEREGVARARGAAGVADLRLVVLDRSEPLREDDRRLLMSVEHAVRLVAVNKADLPPAWELFDLAGHATSVVEVSAQTLVGLEELRLRIFRLLTDTDATTDPVLVTNVRHSRLLEEARACVHRARDAAAAHVSEEFVLADVAQIVRLFDQVTQAGSSDPTTVLDAIFARFCIGK